MSRLEIFEYNPEWPRMFEEEAAQLKPIWGDQLIAVYHIGSTAVPGLAAKPIIDSMLVIKDISRIHEFDDGMISLGYRPRGECLDAFGTPGRFYYSKDTNGIRTHQAHVMEAGHFDIERKLNFRDYLRSHPAIARAYGELKSKLVEENTRGIGEYIEGKNAFINDCIIKASMWRNTEQDAAPDGDSAALHSRR